MNRTELRKATIEAGIYKCNLCNKVFRDAYDLKSHLNKLIHHPERKVSYDCHLCNFHTIQKTIFKTHEATRKHQRRLQVE